MKRFGSLLVVPLFAALVSMWIPHADAALPSCAERFPEAQWRQEIGGAVSLESSGMSQPFADRFARDVRLVTSWIRDEIGSFEATVCLVGDDSSFDATRWETESRRFHARMEMEENLLAIKTDRAGFVAPASAWGLAHHALWQHGVEGGNPEPISSVIAHWYRARILDRLDQYHRDVMVDNFFDTEAVIVWASDTQPPVLDWDPENNFRAIGDFVDFAVAKYGNEVLLESDGDRWSEIEAEWRVALRADLTGRTTPTRDWIVGVSIALLIVLVALGAAAAGVWSKRRRRARPPTADAIPGFFSE